MNRWRFLACFACSVASISAVAAEPAAKQVPFITVSNPPPIQMLVPGFIVRELPLQLNNINNLVYAPDGRLFALCYDGNVLQLKDTDGDGLEDTATHFFKNDNNEILATIGMCWGPGGLYIPNKGRIIRLRDKGDGTAELQTVASGWIRPAVFGGSSLDAVAITVDAQGDLYFGLGCDQWNAAYRVNKQTGKSEYNVQSERGTIIKVPAGSTNREVICTGMRWPCSLAFNAAGDLFCTDQEGATWLPNGNPFDELLHIQKGRHYGFPPRHPEYLPNVIDEPSVFDYAPQHESTCGMHFNDGKRIFGPSWWRGDAIVSGESRGKIFRTKLVKSVAGYVAQNNLIACVSMLTIDAVPTPDGDLIVTCHSGKPDWGTGPKGRGKLFKISYVDTNTPQPVLAYAASQVETRIVFDRPMPLGALEHLASKSSITFGKYLTAGDRFESFRPGYKVVEMQMKESRFELPIISGTVSADGRAIDLFHRSQTAPFNYAVTFPATRIIPAGVTQHHDSDVVADLTGVKATFRDKGGTTLWSGWLPHLDLLVAQQLTAASEEHRRLFSLLTNSGTLRLETQLDLWQMLHPAVQIGSKLDFEYPPENVVIDFKGSVPLRMPRARRGLDWGTALGFQLKVVNERELRLPVKPVEGRWTGLDLELQTGPAAPRLEIAWHTAEDPRDRALPLRRLFLPFAAPAQAEPTAVDSSIPEITGGDWQNGRKLFFGEQLACFKCHQANGEGGKIGPDLSNLIHRDYASVMKDITQPSAALNPDHLAYNIELNDGEIVNGVIVKDDSQTLSLGLANGATSEIPKSKIKHLEPSAISLMPENLLQSLNDRQRKDLMTFLLTAKPGEKRND